VRRISRKVTEPVRIAGLDLNDLFASLLVFAVLYLQDQSFTGLAAMVGIAVGLKRYKRGRPRGVLLHAACRIGLLAPTGAVSPARTPRLAVRAEEWSHGR
jgi:type IV conjugative transfer system protein TraL